VTLVAFAAACDVEKVDATMGARCTTTSDCAQRCLPPSDEFPGGMCTVDCLEDGDCPSDATCVAGHGGVCLYTCRDDADCTFLGDFGGVKWTCREDSADRPHVCRGPGEVTP
jgi:hypothetical protein